MWDALRTAAKAAAARAWVFEAERGGDRFIEFLEWQENDGISVLEDEEVLAALDELNTRFHTEDSATWLETKI